MMNKTLEILFVMMLSAIIKAFRLGKLNYMSPACIVLSKSLLFIKSRWLYDYELPG